MIAELFYSHIVNMVRGSLHTKSFRCIHVSVHGYRLTICKSGFADLLTFFLATLITPVWKKKIDSKQHLLQQWLYGQFSSFWNALFSWKRNSPVWKVFFYLVNIFSVISVWPIVGHCLLHHFSLDVQRMNVMELKTLFNSKIINNLTVSGTFHSRF